MAQVKITQLTEKTSPVASDLIEIVSDPSGTPASRKATLKNSVEGSAVAITTGVAEAGRTVKLDANGVLDISMYSTTTASNVGTSGVGIYKQKTLLDHEFYKLDNTDLLIDIALNGTDKIDINLGAYDAAPEKTFLDDDDLFLIGDSVDFFNHKKYTYLNLYDQLTVNFLDKPTYDPAAIAEQLVGISAVQVLGNKTIDAAANTILNIGASEVEPGLIRDLPQMASVDIATDLLIVYDADATDLKYLRVCDIPFVGGGEVNTASNVGVGGVGVFKQKVGMNLEFKNISSSNPAIIVADDVVSNEIEIGFDTAQIDLSLTNNDAGFITAISTDVLQNKTIDTSNNTITNLDTTNFAANIIDTDDTLAANSDLRIPTQQAVKAYVDNNISTNGATFPFTNSNLSLGLLNWVHLLGVDYPAIVVYDNNRRMIIPDEVLSVNANSVQVDLSSFAPIGGTWNITATY